MPNFNVSRTAPLPQKYCWAILYPASLQKCRRYTSSAASSDTRFQAMPSMSQAFVNYNFPCTQNRFRCTSVHVGSRAHKRADVAYLIITWYGDRNCIKLVLKPLAAEKGISVIYVVLFLYIMLFQFIWWLPLIFVQCATYLNNNGTIFWWIEMRRGVVNLMFFSRLQNTKC